MSLGKSEEEAGFEKPVPRPPKSQAKLAQLQQQNRRREYLRRNPSYLSNIEHELADPILYERLVKRYQTPAEREAEGKVKGYGRTLEADLVRGETRLANLDPSEPSTETGLDATAWEEASAESKEHGLELWSTFLQERFVQGRDDEFDYSVVDTNDDLDVEARNEAEDAWFDQEDPGWASDESPSDYTYKKEGETGIQDF
ncbi:hypothetical protein PT974_01450 [Cladobotryum mycophilum]|uniref:CCD97-like C-terminal domain-containing protein n=1 Tax=Cladobotryum mycophilum TaxID=491253 RepID=A0ABR0T4N0_9HYPO